MAIDAHHVSPRDAGGSARDAGGGARDTGGAARDAGGAPRDAGGAPRDAGGAPRDAGGAPRGADKAPRGAELGDRGTGVALWARLAESLRRRLAAGEFDERFPTEAELGAEYAVSRATVREAVRRLRGEGLIEARQGAGTFVLQRQLDEPILGRLGLARMIEGAGLDEASRLLHAAAVPAGPHAAAVLGCRPDAEAVVIERLRVAGGEVIALDRSVVLVRGQLRARVLAAPLDRGSLYDVLAARAGIRVDAGREAVRAVAPDAADRRRLALARGEGVLELERVAYAGGTPVEWRRTLLKGSHYVFGTSWGSPPPAAPLPGGGPPTPA